MIESGWKESWSTYLFDAQGEIVPLVEKMNLLYLRLPRKFPHFWKTPRKVVTYATENDDIIKIRVPRDTNTL